MAEYIYAVMFQDMNNPTDAYVHDRYFGSLEEVQEFLTSWGYSPMGSKHGSSVYAAADGESMRPRAFVHKLYRM